jgi:uncharacterized membrane protein YphA (DoxX/SURF4 family)
MIKIMKMSEPLGNQMYAPFFVRVGLGMFFYFAGRSKLDGLPGYVLPEFVKQVKGFNLLPDQAATVYAILLPYFQILIGVLLIAGLWTTFAGGAAALIIGSFIYLFGVFSGPPAGLLNKDVVLLGGALSLLYSGAGFLSIDRFRKSG